MQTLNRIAQICVIVSLGSLSACSSVGERQKSSSDKPLAGVIAQIYDPLRTTLQISEAPAKIEQIPTIDQTIIQDLAGVISQIFDPFSTTLQINSTESDHTLNYFVTVMANEGFGIQRVSADQGANFVSYSRTNKSLNDSSNVSFSILVGAVTVAREYQVMADNIVAPASPVKLSGTRASVTINDTVSSTRTVIDPSLSKAQYVASLGLSEQAPMISLITPEIVNSVASQSGNGTSRQAFNSSKVEVNNLFYTNQSTFASLLDDYSQIYKYVIVFGNDSLVLGETNKSLIDQLVENVLSDDDIVNLIGCSNGPTSLDIGNEGLALGRASRVTDALIARGVPRENVLDEGCWAPVAGQQDRFPKRGVVLELWRRNT